MPCRKKRAAFFFDRFENYSEKIPWDCFVYIMRRFLNFEMINKGGSVRLFEREGIKFTAHEPHGKGDDFVSKFDRQRAINEIKKLNLLK